MPGEHTVLGAFTDGKNVLKISDPAPVIGDPGVHYVMQQGTDGFYLEAFSGFDKAWEVRKERLDLVVGSGVRGQTFLYWQGDGLYELPVSYWKSKDQWINSPGYRNGPPVFDRPATSRCLECHFSYARVLDTNRDVNRYDRASVVSGITCEVCHGPGAMHAAAHAHAARPAFPVADEAIVNPRKLSPQRQVDLCALCHSGASRILLSASFSYRPGQPLSQHLGPEAKNETHPDVHADQVGLLQRSKCFLTSKQMTCSTCHDVHQPERVAASYSARCLACHTASSCGLSKVLGTSIVKNCIDCHMPMQQSNAIVSETGDEVIRTSMRTHWIKVYAEQNQLPQ